MVTQGTDSLEEVALALDLLWRHDEPLVVTGAMRNPMLAGADGPANVLAAALVAAAPASRRRGALVVLNDEIHAARWVRKTHSTSPAAFVSAPAGPVGLAAAKPVVLASRTGAGPVLDATYTFPGSETDLLSHDLVSAGMLDPLKARLLLHLLIAAGHGPDGVRAAFAALDPAASTRPGGGAIIDV